jgi:hypothetical protein
MSDALIGVPTMVVVRFALHCAVVPPFVPAQLHVYVEVFVVTLEAVPVVQRFEVGAVLKVWPFAVPQVPFIGVTVCANVAVTLLFAVMETVQDVVPVHAPLQPENVYPVWGVAVRVTEVPDVYVSEQSVPQEMPVPEMVPPPVTPVVRVYVAGGGGVEVEVVYEYVRPFVRGSVLSLEAKRMDCVVVSPQWEYRPRPMFRMSAWRACAGPSARPFS